MFDNRRLDACLHDTIDCQTGCNRFVNRVERTATVQPRIHDTTGCETGCQIGCQTGLTTGCIVYTNIQPVVTAGCIV